jgi:uncharacterized protein YbcI
VPRAPADEQGPLLADISRALVGVQKRFYGKGPTKARTYLVEDLVVCVLGGGYTQADRTLLATGREELVDEQRHALQEALESEFVGAIEALVGRRVVGFLSANDPEAELMVEIFVLAPEERDPAAQQAAAVDGHESTP